jgi:Tfp pilus assembly protein FimT
MAVVAVVAGILAALAMPSMMGMQERNKINSTANRVKGVLREAQQSAVRKGQSCTVAITSTTITGSPTGCVSDPITTNDTTAQGVILKTVSSSAITDITSSYSITFSYKGNPTGDMRTYIITANSNDNNARCLAISLGVGIMRTGLWSGGSCVSTF